MNEAVSMKAESPELRRQLEYLVKVAEDYRCLIERLDTKVYTLRNVRKPTDVPDVKQIDPECYYDELSVQVNRVNDLNEWLRRINDDLDELF